MFFLMEWENSWYLIWREREGGKEGREGGRGESSHDVFGPSVVHMISDTLSDCSQVRSYRTKRETSLN